MGNKWDLVAKSVGSIASLSVAYWIMSMFTDMPFSLLTFVGIMFAGDLLATLTLRWYRVAFTKEPRPAHDDL